MFCLNPSKKVFCLKKKKKSHLSWKWKPKLILVWICRLAAVSYLVESIRNATSCMPFHARHCSPVFLNCAVMMLLDSYRVIRDMRNHDVIRQLPCRRCIFCHVITYDLTQDLKLSNLLKHKWPHADELLTTDHRF